MLGSFFIAFSVSPTWSKLAGLLSRIADGAQDTSVPGGMDPVNTVIALRARGALAGRVPIPDDLWPMMLAEGDVIGQLVVAIVHNDRAGALKCVRFLTTTASGKDAADLSRAVRTILAGSRDPALAERLKPAGRAIILTVLTHVGARREERPGAGTSLADRISALDGRKAICALEFVLCVTGEQADPGALQEMEPRLIEALAQRGLRELATPDPAATPGSLACVALEHLAARK